jgi:hypothetical protein
VSLRPIGRPPPLSVVGPVRRGKIPNPPRLLCSSHRCRFRPCAATRSSRRATQAASRPALLETAVLEHDTRFRSLAACRCCRRDAQAKRLPTTRGNRRQLPHAPSSSSSSRRSSPAPSTTWPPLQSVVATSPRTPTQRQGPCELSPPRALQSDASRSQRRCPPYPFSMRVRLV